MNKEEILDTIYNKLNFLELEEYVELEKEMRKTKRTTHILYDEQRIIVFHLDNVPLKRSIFTIAEQFEHVRRRLSFTPEIWEFDFSANDFDEKMLQNIDQMMLAAIENN